MKLQFKHQKFQADAAQAVADIFAGQPHRQMKMNGELKQLKKALEEI